jgi:predicted MFS family arabinose efflux permease
VLYAISTLGLLLSEDLHFKTDLLGYLIMSSFGIASLLSLWAGGVVDKLGSRYSLIMLFIVIAIAFSLIISVQSFNGLMLAVAVCGIAQALANPVTNLLIAEQVPLKKKASVVGLKQSGVQLAALFAGLVLPSIAFAYGWRLSFGIIIPLALLFACSTPFITPKQHQNKSQGFKTSAPKSLLLLLMSVQFCVGISLSAFVTFLPVFATQQSMSLRVAGSLIAVFGVMGIISRILLTPLGSKLKDESYLLLALIAITAIAMGVTMQATPTSHWQLWAGAIGVGLTAVATNAIVMSMLIRDAKFGVVTKASGFVSVAFFGGFALGPPLYGNLVHYSGFALGWSTLIGVLIVGCLMTLCLAMARKHNLDITTEEQQPSEITLLKSEVFQLKQQLTLLERNYSALLLEIATLTRRLKKMEITNQKLITVNE